MRLPSIPGEPTQLSILCSESHGCLLYLSPFEEEHTGLGLFLHNLIFGRTSKQTGVAFADGGKPSGYLRRHFTVSAKSWPWIFKGRSPTGSHLPPCRRRKPLKYLCWPPWCLQAVWLSSLKWADLVLGVTSTRLWMPSVLPFGTSRKTSLTWRRSSQKGSGPNMAF